jgi:hypothetical protein
VALAAVAIGLVAVPAASAWTVTMTANAELKRTHSWKIEKSVSKSAVTLKAGETADVTYTVVATPTGSVDSNYAVVGNVNMTRDPVVDVAWLNVNVYLDNGVNDPNGIPATVSCVPNPFPVDLGLEGLDCQYSAALPNTADRFAQMRAQRLNPDGTLGNFRGEQVDFNFLNPTVHQVDESVTVTDSMGGTLGTVNAADGPKTFTYTKTIGPYTAAQCGSKTVDNTATFTTVDSGTTGSASAGVAVTVTCPPPPPPKCALPSLAWKLIGLLGPHYFATLLPQKLGTSGGPKTVNVSSTLQGMSILFKEWISTNVVDLLSTEQLAAKLNAASGRDVSSIAATMAAVDAFLATHNASSSLSTSQKTQVKAWTVTLEAYNNKCIPDIGHGDHDWCKKHWDKPDHDWGNWNWKKFDWDDH